MMEMYTGRSADGSDMERVYPFVYTSPNEKFWGSEPISLKEEQQMDWEFNRKESRRDRRARERLNK